ncbi:MAG: 3-phosphoshikimate 1-carboxyvinyltransferase [Anaerolineales bacterium]|nr:3-phosphoshikimate 1-carboxyvinyltransferase [Anaerolineales bacterium]
MHYQIRSLQRPLNARLRLPGSKSHTNRALLVAALAEGVTTLENALFSDDARLFAAALQQLGFEVALQPASSRMQVTGHGGHIPARQADLFIGNAGTAARFLTAFLTLGQGEFRLDGVARMRRRPIADLVAALNHLGAQVTATSGRPPVQVQAAGLPGGQTQVRGAVSSQYLSALLMVAPYAAKTVHISVTGELNSRPYIDLTLGVMADFGVGVERDDYASFQVRPARYQAIDVYPIESDASTASYFFAAPAICGGQVQVEGLTRHSRQGDLAFLDVLAQMGCQVHDLPDAIQVSGPSRLAGVQVNLRDLPDTAQTLAAIAPFASSPTTIRGIASARLKETDRVAATCRELQRLGVQVEEYPDGLKIYPCAQIRPARIRTYDDHRMAMAFALVGLRLPGIEIEDPACVAKTFPDYFEYLERL